MASRSPPKATATGSTPPVSVGNQVPVTSWSEKADKYIARRGKLPPDELSKRGRLMLDSILHKTEGYSDDEKLNMSVFTVATCNDHAVTVGKVHVYDMCSQLLVAAVAILALTVSTLVYGTTFGSEVLALAEGKRLEVAAITSVWFTGVFFIEWRLMLKQA
mmetsp:Transcript_8960/g.18079  ORF Transcript_8960/g.18079 Transcript_8960/m.18079 type:complete len:161 (-) Transcript_8960:155-637(-)